MRKHLPKKIISILLFFIFSSADKNCFGQEQSIAREWKYELLHAIRNDFARPPIHARNLFHLSIAMYDAWAAFNPEVETYFLGKTTGNFECPYNGIAIPDDIQQARTEAISYAAYRLIRHRFQNSPGFVVVLPSINSTMTSHGFDINYTSTAYETEGAKALGNYIASKIIEFGFQDGSNEQNNFGNMFYAPVNPDLNVVEPGNPTMVDPNRWQKVAIIGYVDQSGNQYTVSPPFLCPEWGNVVGFALADSVKTTNERDNQTYHVFHDPGAPVLLDTTDPSGLSSLYKWSFLMVPAWQSHLDPSDGVMWDISPASIGNNQILPETFDEHPQFYNYFDGGDIGIGHSLNPITGQPYEPQIVPRGDYTRAVAEFWADGPSSETPPGHWFTIYHEVSEHPLFEWRWNGQDEPMDHLEFDVKTYLTLGGGSHDAAIAAWSVKGWYDYPRPISIIRYMAEKGQCSDPDLPNYHPAGIPIVPGYFELVLEGDELAGDSGQHVGKIKLYTWKGHDFIPDPEVDVAGVGWILAENWYTYQRPSFVTPPFAGYVSGHSTYSRTAAEIMTSITGTPYFPGGMSNFVCPQNEFLVFEQGPSVDVVLQWATYQDASDQCSLSRIWGGIHPPVDDIPGRLMGIEIGNNAYNYANEMFEKIKPTVSSLVANPAFANISNIGQILNLQINFDQEMNTNVSPELAFINENPLLEAINFLNANWIDGYTFNVNYSILDSELNIHDIYLSVKDAISLNNIKQNAHLAFQPFVIDTKRPEVLSVNPSTHLINDNQVLDDNFTIEISFSENCDTTQFPQILLSSALNIANTFTFNPTESNWSTPTIFNAKFNLADEHLESDNISISIANTRDAYGNLQLIQNLELTLSIDTKNPEVSIYTINQTLFNLQSIGSNAITIMLNFNEPMNVDGMPDLNFSEPLIENQMISKNLNASQWVNELSYRLVYNINNINNQFQNVNITGVNFMDLAGNLLTENEMINVFSIDLKRPLVEEINAISPYIADVNANASGYNFTILFDESMNTNQKPLIEVLPTQAINGSISYNFTESNWLNNQIFEVKLNIVDQNLEVDNLQVKVQFAQDAALNSQLSTEENAPFKLDTKNPEVTSLVSNHSLITQNLNSFELTVTFSEPMLNNLNPVFQFPGNEMLNNVFTLNTSLSNWESATSYKAIFNIAQQALEIENIEVSVIQGKDLASNDLLTNSFLQVFSINQNIVNINEVENNTHFHIYPNPVVSGENLFLYADANFSQTQIRLVDLNGKIIMQKLNFALSKGANQLAMENISSGIYMLIIEGEQLNARFRTIIID